MKYRVIIKKLLLNKSKFFTIILMLLAFSGNVNAQCSITGTAPNSSAYNLNPCISLTSCGGILYIGNGTAATKLTMDASLNLTCLGAIQLIIRNNASIDFSPGNSYLTLAAGSSITFEGSGTLIGGSSCSASERIYIGTDLVATCNGQGLGADYNFTELIAAGGFNIVTISPTSASACVSGSFSFTATAIPSATATAVRWYSAAIGGTLLQTTSGNSSTYITPTISSTTTYYAEATIGAFITPRKAVVTTIIPLPTTALAGADQSNCNTTAFILAGNVPTIGTGLWTVVSGTAVITTPTSNTSGVTGITAGTSATLRWTISNGSCAASSDDVVLTNNATLTAPASATTQPTCAVPTGTITITGVYGETYSFDSGAYSATLVYSGLAQGSSHTIYAKNAAGCISSVKNVVISSLVTNTWNGSLWSTGSPPTINQNIVFASFANVNSNIVACSCQANADVTINSGYTITLTNGLTVANTANVVFKNGSSLVQINNVANSGDIEYERNTQSRNTDYTYFSSPVSPQTLYDLSPLSLAGSCYSYEPTATSEGWKQEASSTTMLAGKGYIVRGPEAPGTQTPPTTAFNVAFYGVPNNGTIPINNVLANKSYLLGNPYPSALDADTFLNVNNGVLEGTIYFWTHNTQIGIGVSNPGTGLYAYSNDDYASYNTTGGVGTGNSINGVEQIANKPTGKIAAGQGFFATSIANGTITYTNAMRVAGNNSQFFKKRNSKTEKVIEKNRVWLNLTNTQGAFKQTLVGYITDATNDYDDRFDGESFDGNEFVDFYSINQDKNLVIQGRALPFDENDEVPLGYRTTINGDFTINIDQVDGLMTNQAVFIEDKMTNTVTDLKSGNYTFNTIAGTFNDRFVLRFTNTNKTLATSTFDTLENKVLVSNKNRQIKINSFAKTIDKVTIYDLLGRQIYLKEKVNSNELSIVNLLSSRQTLIVKTELQNGQTVTNKIVY